MEHDHLDAEILERLLALDRTEEQNRSLLHQIAVCRECRAVGGWLLDLHRSGALPRRFGVVEIALARSRAAAPALWQKLERFPQEKRLALVRATRRFASWGLGELLCGKSLETVPADAAQAAELAELAVSVADAVEEEGGPAEDRWIYQLRALAWAHLANAQRVGGGLPAAERAFDMADSWWKAGAESIGDVLGYEPILLNLKASLRIAQRRFDEALGLLDEVAEIYRSGDAERRDSHLAGRALVQKSHALIEMGETERAIAALREAETLIEPEREPRLLFCLRHDLAYCLATAGRYMEADILLPDLWTVVQAHGSHLDAVRVRWVEARIVGGLGDGERARQMLLTVQQELLAAGIAYDAALATLELAVLALEADHTSQVKTLAAGLAPIFAAQGVTCETLATLELFREAVRQETITADLARRWLEELRRAAK